MITYGVEIEVFSVETESLMPFVMSVTESHSFLEMHAFKTGGQLYK